MAEDWRIIAFDVENVHDSIDSLIGEEVGEFFYEKYCDECSLFKVCKHRFNPHCHKVVSDHLKAIMEVTSLTKDAFLAEAKKREVKIDV